MTSDKPHYQTISTEEELRDSPLGRRGFMQAVAGGSTLVLGSGLAGCLGGDDGDDGNELVIARAGDSESLDPHSTTAAYSSMVMELIYDPLIHVDFDGNYTEALGNGWEINDAGTEWTIEVKDDIEFHNGDSFSADDVVFTFQRFLEHPSQSLWAAGPLESVEQTGDNSVTFTFGETYAPWRLHSTNAGYFGILPRGPVEEDPDDFASNPVGTGPYMIEEWVRGDHLTLERNPNWNTPAPPAIEAEDPPRPERIQFQTIPEQTPRVEALRQGDIDILISRDFPPADLDTIQEDENTSAEVFTTNNAGYVAFNMEQPPTDDLRVRQALAHAIDKERIINDIYYGLGQENWVPMSENLLGWAGEEVRDEIGFEFNQERSRELLEEAGWVDTGGEFRERDGETLQIELISTNTPPPRLQLAEEMVDMLAQVGVSADLQSFEYNTAYTEFEAGESQVFYGTVAWFEASILNFVWHSDNKGATNLSFLDDPEVDELIEAAASTVDEDERAELYQQAQLTAMEQCPCQPIMTYEGAVGLHSRVQNYKQHPTTLTALYHDVELE